MISFISQARKRARQSNYNFRHGAVIVKGGRVLASGFNIANTRKYIHAEIAAIANSPQTANCTLVVVRILKNGTLSMSRPCEKCWNAINKAGISKVIFSNWGGEITTVRV